MQASAAALIVRVIDQNGKPVRDAVVVAVPAKGAPGLSKAHEEIIDQINKEFVPYVKVVQVGSMVRFPNKDNIRHHVYSFSPAKTFELPLYSGSPADPVLFDRPGVVVLGCNIHDWMIAYVYVSESPYFAQTGDDGVARLPELPREDFRARVWHPDLVGTEAATTRVVTAAEENANEVHDWTVTLKPSIRVRRPTSESGRNYQ
jgi:plastocyanin